MRSKQSQQHAAKMERFHTLVDQELSGSIEAGEREELNSLKAYIAELTKPTAKLIEQRIALQDQVIQESMELIRQLKAGEPPSSSKATVKSAKTGGRV